MCLYAVKQVSAQQAEPAATAVADVIGSNAKSQYGMLGVHEVRGKLYLEIPDSLLGRDILAVNRIADVIGSNAKSQYGMLGVHEVRGKLYLEIPDSLLGRDILAVNRIAKGWAGDKPFDPFLNFLGYSGDLMGETLFRFDKESDGTLNLYIVDYSDRIQTNDGSPMLPPNADLLSALHSFPILCRNKAGDASMVDGTDFLSGDNAVMTFSSTLRKKFGVSSMNAQKSSLQSIEVTDTHTVVSSVKTYAYRNGETVRMAIRSTWFLLPKIPYEIRKPDHRVGYYTQAVRDYSDPFKPEQSLRMVKRWRIEPRPEDREAYFRGELVEPRRPIVIYIDPAMPKEWVPYMIQGVNDWQQAFEQAGFKNAIRGEQVPFGMESQMVGDARYPMVCYKPSPIANATAELVTDPRSGEILNAHIAWHHGHMQNILKWGRVMGSVHRPMLRRNKMDTAFMGAMVRKIIAHEVGHVLGLMHNFGASSTVPVENLRNPEWLAAHPISPSIMDYIRVNYVAQPEDDVSLSGLIPRIGVYDRWAVEWGYRLRAPTGDVEKDREILNDWTKESVSRGELWYGAEGRQSFDPRCQAEDLGDDPVLAAGYGVDNLKRMMDSLTVWYPNQANEVCREIIGQYGNYLNHVAASIDTDAGRPELAFMMDHFIGEPYWLVGRLPNASGGGSAAAHLAKCQQQVLAGLLGALAANGSHDILKLLQSRIFRDPYGQSEYEQRMQLLYVTEIARLADASGKVNPATIAGARYHAGLHKRELSAGISERIRKAASNDVRFHLESLLSILSAIPTN
ncbi:zinc-dependent metalloprotease [Parapedobacter soli]